MPIVTRTELKLALGGLPRVRLAHLPTPLEACPRFSRLFDGPRVWIKRDDCTGLAFGGNKARQHEYILGDALARGVDVVIQGAASQSNQSRQLAAAAARLGIRCVLMPRKDARFDEVQGNQLIARRFGAEIVPIDPMHSAKAAKEAMADKLKGEGHTPAILGMGSVGALSLATVSYIGAYCEMIDQFEMMNEQMPTHIYVTSQGSTQAGLQAAVALLGHQTIICGINPMDARNEAYEPPHVIAQQCRSAARLLGFDITVPADDILNSTDYVGKDYGQPSEAAQEAADMLASSEGILVDPVYSAKGLSGLVGDLKAGKFGASDRVVFLHTGGLPAIFSYAETYESD